MGLNSFFCKMKETKKERMLRMIPHWMNNDTNPHSCRAIVMLKRKTTFPVLILPTDCLNIISELGMT